MNAHHLFLALVLLASPYGRAIAKENDNCDVYRTTPKQGILPQSASAEILKRMRNAYATAKSYQDEGEVMVEKRPPGAELYLERATFRTNFSSPKNYLFDQTKSGSGNERYVIWSDGERFSTWWSATGVHEKYERGKGIQAFSVSAFPTMGAVMQIAPLLFATSDLVGPVRSMTNAELLGVDASGDRCLYKLSARIRLNHWAEADRETVVWIDASDFLVRKIVEETPSNAANGQVDRTTTTLTPAMGKPIPAADFLFSPPGTKP
ncbi:MAG: DUF2092 domain-containing protein [Pseudomonadales bacterium]